MDLKRNIDKDYSKYTGDSAIEDLLKPRCDFHVSAGFKERVLAEVGTKPAAKKRKRIARIAAISTAAAAAFGVIMTISYFIGNQEPEKNNGKMASVVITLPKESDLQENDGLQIPAPGKDFQEENATGNKTKARYKAPKHLTSGSSTLTTADHITDANGITHPGIPNSGIQTEGEMPMAVKTYPLGQPDPDEVRQRMIESQLKAEIAYIDRMRVKIEANDAYIGQLMTIETVYK